MPSWSPDGREVAYYGFRGGHRRLFVIPAIGGTPSPVVSDSGNQRFPDWSPDGQRLVYHSDRTGRFELYAVEREVGGRWKAPRQLTTEGGQDARWSPDGQQIIFVTDALDGPLAGPFTPFSSLTRSCSNGFSPKGMMSPVTACLPSAVT